MGYHEGPPSDMFGLSEEKYWSKKNLGSLALFLGCNKDREDQKFRL